MSALLGCRQILLSGFPLRGGRGVRGHPPIPLDGKNPQISIWRPPFRKGSKTPLTDFFRSWGNLTCLFFPNRGRRFWILPLQPSLYSLLCEFSVVSDFSWKLVQSRNQVWSSRFCWQLGLLRNNRFIHLIKTFTLWTPIDFSPLWISRIK